MQFRRYFYGSDGNLNPFTTVATFEQVHIVRVGMGFHVPATALPLGAQSTLDPLQISQVSPSIELLHCILGVSQAEEEEKIVDSPVYGFVHVTKVCLWEHRVNNFVLRNVFLGGYFKENYFFVSSSSRKATWKLSGDGIHSMA